MGNWAEKPNWWWWRMHFEPWRMGNRGEMRKRRLWARFEAWRMGNRGEMRNWGRFGD